MCRKNPFARHNLFLASPVIPLASSACDSARPQDLVQPQTKPLRAHLLSTDNPPNPACTCSAISKTAMPYGRTRTLTALRRRESHFAKALRGHNFANPNSEEKNYECSNKL